MNINTLYSYSYVKENDEDPRVSGNFFYNDGDLKIDERYHDEEEMKMKLHKINEIFELENPKEDLLEILFYSEEDSEDESEEDSGDESEEDSGDDSEEDSGDESEEDLLEILFNSGDDSGDNSGDDSGDDSLEILFDSGDDSGDELYSLIQNSNKINNKMKDNTGDKRLTVSAPSQGISQN